MQDVQDLLGRNKFDEARAVLEALIAGLSAAASEPSTESAIERRIAKEGNEVMRLLLQGCLDERAKRALSEARSSPRPAGEQVRTSTRPLESRFGRVRICRPGLKKAGEASRFGLDRELNLPRDPYSLVVRERVAEEAIRGSFDEALAAIERGTGAHVPKRQAEQLVARAAQDFEAFYERGLAGRAGGLAANDNEAARPKMLLVATCDSKGVTMIDEGLREGTRAKKAALRTKKTKGDPLKRTSGRKHDKRMAIVTAVFEQQPQERAAEDIVSGLRKEGEARKQMPRPQNKHVEASVQKSQKAGIAGMFDEVERRDPDHQRHVPVLVDGEEKQIKQVERQAKNRGLSFTIVLDLLHVLHYLWLACHTLTKKNEVKSEALVNEMLLRLLTGPANYVAAALRQRATLAELSPKGRKAVDRCCDYLLKNQAYLNYRDYLARGYPIATGVIEGACRHLVQDRMGITGARWGLETAEAILRLRALRTNGDWEAYWAFHEQREFERNYAKSA